MYVDLKCVEENYKYFMIVFIQKYFFFVKHNTNIELQLKENDVLFFYEYTVDFKISILWIYSLFMENYVFINVNEQWKN